LSYSPDESEEIMRNTTMRDKLQEVFSAESTSDRLENSSSDEVLAAMRATRRKLTKKTPPTPITRLNPFKNESFTRMTPESRATAVSRTASPRYVPPPRRANPFAVHTYAVVTETAEESEEQKAGTEKTAKTGTEGLGTEKTAKTGTEGLGTRDSETEKAGSKELVTWDLETATQMVVEAAKMPASDLTSEPVSAPPGKTERGAPAAPEKDESLQAAKPMAPATPPAVEVKPTLEIQNAAPAETSLPSSENAVLSIDQNRAATASQATPATETHETASVISQTNLSWLEQPTLFREDLKDIVDRLRDAKNNIAFALEQSRGREKKLQEELFDVQYAIEQQKENLRKIDNTISACALVAEQSTGIQPGLLTTTKTHHKTEENGQRRNSSGSRRWNLNDPSMCRQEDIIKFFAANGGRNWTAGEIRETLPAIKRAHAKKYLNVLLATLYKNGKVQRVGEGIYRAIDEEDLKVS